MKHIILMALFLAPVSYAADYRQEIMDNIWIPCAKWTVDRDVEPDYREIVLEQVLHERKDSLAEATDKFNDALLAITDVELTPSLRKRLYKNSLDSCIAREQS